ncbi:hypothetical protein AHMF7605_22515 [Adhaeribacter arboris]|uniref:Ada DNA repair metal-binding domain-containing protein n=1 Tax=Adhaeribacter arboris TaxID=2072846 RepID=A0A2T2YKS9_9BACT|nr:hypothetical protein [Adhaeribacter arboris]PSR56075.1 hypothetical protein AHMF7605_22515 [Adhaeribacter arboris]
MKQLLLLLAFLLHIGSAPAQTANPAKAQATTSKPSVKKQQAPPVYICEGGSAYAYHRTESCAGLNRCTHTILAVSKADAENSYGRRPCKKCY